MVLETRQVIKMIEIRRIKYFGHVMPHNTFIFNIVDMKVYENRGKGLSKNINLYNIKKLLSLPNYEAI